MLGKLLMQITFKNSTFSTLHVIQCNISAMRVTGPAFLALIWRELATRVEQVCGYVVQHMLNIITM